MRCYATSKHPGKYLFHSFDVAYTGGQSVITKVAIARFSRTFASLMAAGVGVWMHWNNRPRHRQQSHRTELALAAEEVKNGRQLSEVLGESPHFPRIVSQMLAVGEETGKTDTVLVKVADFYEEEVATTIDSLASSSNCHDYLMVRRGLIAASVWPIASMSSNVAIIKLHLIIMHKPGGATT